MPLPNGMLEIFPSKLSGTPTWATRLRFCPSPLRWTVPVWQPKSPRILVSREVQLMFSVMDDSYQWIAGWSPHLGGKLALGIDRIIIQTNCRMSKPNLLIYALAIGVVTCQDSSIMAAETAQKEDVYGE